MIKKINNFINGRFENSTSKTIPVWNPQNGEKLTEVTCSSKKELNNAVSSAKSAFYKWSNLTLKERVDFFYEFRNELKNNITSLANSICQENGKTFEEARAEILKGIELTEFACSMPQIIHDEIQEVSRGVECRSSHVPLGIVASITPFNFPIMVPMWTIPNAIVLGNCMILKPSEQTPVGASKIAELLKKSR